MKPVHHALIAFGAVVLLAGIGGSAYWYASGQPPVSPTEGPPSANTDAGTSASTPARILPDKTSAQPFTEFAFRHRFGRRLQSEQLRSDGQITADTPCGSMLAYLAIRPTKSGELIEASLLFELAGELNAGDLVDMASTTTDFLRFVAGEEAPTVDADGLRELTQRPEGFAIDYQHVTVLVGPNRIKNSSVLFLLARSRSAT